MIMSKAEQLELPLSIVGNEFF